MPLYSLRRARCRQSGDLNPGLPHTQVGECQGEVTPGLGPCELEVPKKVAEGGWVDGTALGYMDEGQPGDWKRELEHPRAAEL